MYDLLTQIIKEAFILRFLSLLCLHLCIYKPKASALTWELHTFFNWQKLEVFQCLFYPALWNQQSYILHHSPLRLNLLYLHNTHSVIQWHLHELLLTYSYMSFFSSKMNTLAVPPSKYERCFQCQLHCSCGMTDIIGWLIFEDIELWGLT